VLGRRGGVELLEHPLERRHQSLALGAGALAHPEHRHHHVLPHQLEVDVVALVEPGADLVAGATGAADVDREPERVPVGDAGAAREPLVEDVEPGQRADRLARAGHGHERLTQHLPPLGGGVPARGVERREQERVRAGRLDQRHRAVDHVLVEPRLRPGTEVEHRRLGQAADHLVGARDHEVRARVQRRLRQVLVEREVRSPGLVDHQRQPASVRRLRQPADVGHRPEVGRRDHHRPYRLRGPLEPAVELLRGDAVGEVELGVELGLDEGGPEPRQHQPVDRRGVDVPLDHYLAALGVRQRQRGDVVSLRRAVDQEPGAASAPGLRRHELGALERGRLDPHVDSAGERGNVERQRPLADRLGEARIGRRTALVPRHVEATRIALGVGAEGVEVGGIELGARRRRGALRGKAARGALGA
jgi:hypothetical protein